MVVTVVVILVVLAAVVAGGIWYARNREQRELAARARRHDQLDVRPLDPERVYEYRDGWQAAQVRFVDAPTDALEEADALIEAAMSEIGYPVGDYETPLADLPIEHADVLRHYRAAHTITMAARDTATDTEQMRRAMAHYRALFSALLNGSMSHGDTAQDIGDDQTNAGPTTGWPTTA